MRFALSIAVALLAIPTAIAQSPSGPSLLPSMVPPERFIAEAISEPWFPPAAPSAAPFTPPSLPAPPQLPAPDTAPKEEAPSSPVETPATAESIVKESAAVEEEALPEVDSDLVEAPWYVPQRWFQPLPWDTGIELGLNGSSGNNESLSVRTGGYMKRESRFSKLNMSGYYNKTTSRDETTQNNANIDVRNDWMLDDESPWTLFGATNLFYDQFQAFDLQVNANTGVGYGFVRRPDLNMIGRVGGGTSREIGGPDDRWVPESLFGFEYNQTFATNQKLYGKIDYFPEWEEFGEYRMVADIGWEVELTQPENLSLKISAMDRYDSSPNGVDPHLLNYSVLLLLKL